MCVLFRMETQPLTIKFTFLEFEALCFWYIHRVVQSSQSNIETLPSPPLPGGHPSSSSLPSRLGDHYPALRLCDLPTPDTHRHGIVHAAFGVCFFHRVWLFSRPSASFLFMGDNMPSYGYAHAALSASPLPAPALLRVLFPCSVASMRRHLREGRPDGAPGRAGARPEPGTSGCWVDGCAGRPRPRMLLVPVGSVGAPPSEQADGSLLPAPAHPEQGARALGVAPS